jgi:hypothetical protein
MFQKRTQSPLIILWNSSVVFFPNFSWFQPSTTFQPLPSVSAQHKVYLNNTFVASSRVRTFLWRWSESTPAYILHPHRQASLLSPNKDTTWALNKVRKQHKREKSLASNYSTVIPFRPLSIQHIPVRNLWHLCPKSRHYMGHSIQSTYATSHYSISFCCCFLEALQAIGCRLPVLYNRTDVTAYLLVSPF